MSNFEEIVINDEIEVIGDNAFESCSGLKRVTIPESSSTIWFGDGVLSYCPLLEEINRGPQTLDKRLLIGMNKNCLGSFPYEYQYGWHTNTLIAYATSGIKDLIINDDILGIGNSAFAGALELETVEIQSNIISILSRAFAGCDKLKKVVLPSSLRTIEDAAFLYTSVDSIFIQSPKPPKLLQNVFPKTTTLVVPSSALSVYRLEWPEYSSQIVGKEVDYYISNDYSFDGTTSTLQQSTAGNGIDLIFMGDAFSDRQITDGTYADVMQKAADAFFSEEPYKSFKDHFNVYTVNVVSATEGYEHSGQALSTGHGDGTYVYGNDTKVIEYAKNAIGEDRLDDAIIIVMMNEDAYAGTCFMYDPAPGDYGRGLSISYFPINGDTDIFNGLVLHEAGGHGFAKLADEYAYEEKGTISDEAITSTKVNEAYGWWKNVDFTNDPAQVKWSQFLSDPRYANEGLGCYEGGLTYWSGVWRPTETSIMRYNTGGFNAPSRYAIWYRIGKLAHGEDWEGGYEDFVAYDQVNRTPAAAARRKAQQRNYVEKPLPPLHAPVVVGHSWRGELQKGK